MTSSSQLLQLGLRCPEDIMFVKAFPTAASCLSVTVRRYPASPLPFTRKNSRSMSVNAIKDVTPEEAYNLVKGGKRLMDVRTVEEFVAGHPAGALNIPSKLRNAGGMVPNPEFPGKVSEAFPDKAETIIVSCKSGARSAAAAQAMSQDGYQSLVNVLGGFDAWAAGGLPVEK